PTPSATMAVQRTGGPAQMRSARAARASSPGTGVDGSMAITTVTWPGARRAAAPIGVTVARTAAAVISPLHTTAMLRPDDAIACAASPEMKVGPGVVGFVFSRGPSALGRAGLPVKAP